MMRLNKWMNYTSKQNKHTCTLISGIVDNLYTITLQSISDVYLWVF